MEPETFAGGKKLTFDFVQLANLIKTFAVAFATIVIAFAGFTLATSTNVQQREEWKEVIAGVIVGLILLFVAPLIASQLTGATYCR